MIDVYEKKIKYKTDMFYMYVSLKIEETCLYEIWNFQSLNKNTFVIEIFEINSSRRIHLLQIVIRLESLMTNKFQR